MELSLKKLDLRIDENKKQTKRLSDMGGFWSNQRAVSSMLKKGDDPIIYEVYVHENEGEGDLSYAVTVIHPGDIDGECFMTKGHFHNKSAGEAYLGLEGKGLLVLENREGKTKKMSLEPGGITYVPRDYAHRAINVGDVPLRFLAIYDSAAGHDYGSIEKRGFKEKVFKG
jgi:glucose-6-phosphate isomerase